MARTPKQDRSTSARNRLIEAAIEEFGAKGFAAARTRALATRARTSLRAIDYYFGSKIGLYRASVGHVQAVLASRLTTSAEGARRVVQRGDVTRTELIDAAWELANDASTFSISQLSPSWRRFIEHMQDDDIAALFHAIGPVYDVVFAIVAKAIRRPLEHPEVRLLAWAVLGPFNALPPTRATTLALLGWDELTRAELAHLRRANRMLITRLLAATPEDR